MVMIDLVDEKKSLGVSSVTQVTKALLVGYLPYTRPGHIRAGQMACERVFLRPGQTVPTCRVLKENMSNRAEAPSLVGGLKGA